MTGKRQSGRLRIAYIVGAFPTLSETFIVNQIAGMAALGHDVDVYATCEGAIADVPAQVARHGLTRRTYHVGVSSRRTSGALQVLGLLVAVGWRAPKVIWRVAAEIGVHGFAGSRRLLYAALILVKRGLPRYDIVHAQYGHYGLFALQLKRVGAIDGAIVTSFRGYDVGKYLRSHPRAYDALFRAGASFLPVSRALAERLIEAGCGSAKICVHHSGVAYRQIALPGTVRPDRPVQLITVARLVEKKGVAYAIRAVARLLACAKDVSYTIIGDGPLRAQLQSLIDKLGIGAHVRLVGAMPHHLTLQMVRASHILLAPSVTAADGDTEGIPNVLKEAMALGLPVVATRHGGITELVEDGVSGFLVREADDQAIAERLGYLVDHPELWSAMGRAGRAKIEAEFDSERLNVQLEMLYRGAMEGGELSRGDVDGAVNRASSYDKQHTERYAELP